MEENLNYIQNKWQDGFLPGIDCILYSDGTVIIGNYYSQTDNNNNKHHWYPLCDTSINSLEKYEQDIWTNIDVYKGAFEYENQKIVFGDGAMGNDGFVASVKPAGELNWAMFFTFSNPIYKVEVDDNLLICYGDSGVKISVHLDDLTKITITHKD